MTDSQALPTRKRRIVRMKDIAERSNVSLTTVSRLLRGVSMESFPKSTRDRVFRIARECGWSPNRLVQGIQTGRTGTVGLVMAPFGEYWQAIMVALHRTLLQADSVPIAIYPDYDARPQDKVSTELSHLRHLMERRVDGLICWPLVDDQAIEYLCNICAEQVPVVTIDFELPQTNRSVVIHTQEQAAMYLAVDHLIQLGHQKIGFYGKKDPHSWATNRRQAFINTMRERGLTPVFTQEIAKNDPQAAEQLRHDLPQASAIIAASEQLALSVWHVARDLSLTIPRDLSIVSFGRPYFEFAVCPRFTHIDQHPEQVGKAAGLIVTDSPAYKDLEEPRIGIESSLVVGDTTAPPTAP